MIEIRWTDQALGNLLDIKTFIAQDSPAYALAVVGRLYAAVSQLAEFPDSGRMVPERDLPEVRELVRPPYRIVYRRRSTAIEILLVFRSSLPMPEAAE